MLVRSRTEQKPPEPQKMLDSVQRVRGLAVRNIQITLEPFGEPPLTLSYTDLGLLVDGVRLRLDGRSILPDGQPLALRIEGRVQPQRWQHAEAQVYLSLPQSDWAARSEEHTSELQSLMRISYAVFCLKKKKTKK